MEVNVGQMFANRAFLTPALEAIPRSSVGKILKTALRERLADTWRFKLASSAGSGACRKEKFERRKTHGPSRQKQSI